MSLKQNNLVRLDNSNLSIGQKLIKIGNTYIPVSIASTSGEQYDAYVVIQVSGVLKAQKLSFDGTQVTVDGDPEQISSLKTFNTGFPQPNGSASSSSSVGSMSEIDMFDWMIILGH